MRSIGIVTEPADDHEDVIGRVRALMTGHGLLAGHGRRARGASTSPGSVPPAKRFPGRGSCRRRPQIDPDRETAQQ